MRITVAMATYNGAKYLREQLDSILRQTLLPANIIVCDDRSNDRTEIILEEYRQKGLLTYQINDQRYGVVKNFKRAASFVAPGSCVAFADQDDIWEPHKLQTLADAMSKLPGDKPCMVYSDLILVNEQNIVLNKSFRSEFGQHNYRHNLETLLFNNFVNGCSAMINPALNKLFADTPDNIPFHDGWLALLTYTFGEACYLDEPLVRYRKHGDNASITGDVHYRNRFFRVLDEFAKAIKGNDDFIVSQFETAQRFYDQYGDAMMPEKKAIFERFLKLKKEPYILKKIAFGRTVRKYRI